jgi:hypothetical protein
VTEDDKEAIRTFIETTEELNQIAARIQNEFTTPLNALLETKKPIQKRHSEALRKIMQLPEVKEVMEQNQNDIDEVIPKIREIVARFKEGNK